MALGVVLLRLGAGSARSDEREPFGGDGWYLGLQGAYALEDFDSGGMASADDEFGVNGHAGYRFLENFAVELGIEYIDGFEVEVLGEKGTLYTCFPVRVGGGVEIYLTPHLAPTGNAAYNNSTDDLDSLDYLSVGWDLQYHFGVSETQ